MAFGVRPSSAASSIRLLKIIGAIVGVGILLGIGWAVREMVAPPSGLVDVDELPGENPQEQKPAFAEYFSIFFLGRPGTDTSIRRNTPLIRSTKFITGERVGIRAQTAPGVQNNIAVELRFLVRGTRAESAELQKYRARFSIRPGVSSYCCVRIPRTAGQYDVGLIVNGTYIAFFPTNVVPPQNQGGGGLVPGQK